MPPRHPLHMAVADQIKRSVGDRARLYRDEACGGDQRLPLFASAERSRATQLCNVDALVVVAGTVRVIVEIEESGFIPTKICGKFLTSALATYFIHDLSPEGALPLGEGVLFVQVLDGAKVLRDGTRKDAQANLIAERIREQLPLVGSTITDYRIFLPRGASDAVVLSEMGEYVRNVLST